MQNTYVLKQLARNESMAVVNQRIQQVYEYILKMTPRMPRFETPKDYDQPLLALEKRIDLLQTEKQLLTKNAKQLQERMVDCQRKLMQQSRESEVSRSEAGQWRKGYEVMFTEFTGLVHHRQKLTEEQLKSTFQRQNNSIQEFGDSIERLKEMIKKKFQGEVHNKVRIDELYNLINRNRQSLQTHRTQLQEQSDIMSKLLQKIPLISKVLSKSQENENKLFQIQNYLDLYMPSFVQTQISNTLYCYIEAVDRIKLALFDTKFYEEETERMLNCDGKGTLNERMNAFRRNMEQAKQRIKKVLENKLTRQDITNITSNISKVDDNLVSKSKQIEEVRKITVEIQKKLMNLISQSFVVIRTEKGEIDATLSMIRRESEYNHGKYFDRAYQMEQKMSKSTVEIEFKLKLLQKMFQESSFTELQEMIAKHDYVISKLINQGVLEGKRRGSGSGSGPSTPAHRAEGNNNTFIRGVLMKTAQRRFRFRSNRIEDKTEGS